MAQKNSVVEDIKFEVIEVGEMSEDDVNIVADFIARLAHRNLKMQQEQNKGNKYETKETSKGETEV